LTLFDVFAVREINHSVYKMAAEHLAVVAMLMDEEEDIATTQLQLMRVWKNRQPPLLPAILTVSDIIGVPSKFVTMVQLSPSNHNTSFLHSVAILLCSTIAKTTHPTGNETKSSRPVIIKQVNVYVVFTRRRFQNNKVFVIFTNVNTACKQRRLQVDLFLEHKFKHVCV